MPYDGLCVLCRAKKTNIALKAIVMRTKLKKYFFNCIRLYYNRLLK